MCGERGARGGRDLVCHLRTIRFRKRTPRRQPAPPLPPEGGGDLPHARAARGLTGGRGRKGQRNECQPSSCVCRLSDGLKNLVQAK
eukprot:365452-Chlamydomonas_euryale.AAC.10